jgi:acyl-CoA thioester hydrolase
MSNDEEPLESAGYAAIVTLSVQWGDQDAFGHVNNAIPLRWFETSRIRLLEENGLGDLMNGAELAPLVASIACHFRRQVTYPDTVCVGTRVAELGRSRMTLTHAVYSQSQQRIVADGETVVVFVDRRAQRPTRIPAQVRAALGKRGRGALLGG